MGRILEKEDDELSATDLAVLIQIVELHLGDTHDGRETKDHLHNLVCVGIGGLLLVY